MERTFFKCLTSGRYYYKSIPLEKTNNKMEWYQIVFELLPRYKLDFGIFINFSQPFFMIRFLWFSVKIEKELDLPF